MAIPGLARRVLAICLPLLPGFPNASISAAAHHHPGATVLPCNGITLSASYLAEAAPGQGPGFLFRIENYTAQSIHLAQPVPSSAHWYARVGNRWLWRASAGRGGALVNALNERGPMFAGTFAASGASPSDPPTILTIAAHGAEQWTEPMLNNPAIAYRPSCPQCNYPGESDYQAVFAYAYLPDPQDDKTDLLRCGLRSAPVPMPPHAAAPAH